MATLRLTKSMADAARERLIGQVRSTFNDETRGERPVPASDHALFPRDSVIWRVHGDVTTMMIGGIAALLMQMLHPAVLAGVWDHSNFRQDMLGRLRRTARFIAATTYGEGPAARAAMERVRRIHASIGGELPDGTSYRADDPRSLAWVHACESLCFLRAWIAHGEPNMSRVDQNRYFDQFALIAETLGADPVPRSRADMEAFVMQMRPQLHADARVREVAQLVLKTPAPSMATMPAQQVMMRAAVDLLPDWVRQMHCLNGSGLARPLVAASANAMAGTLRWAFAGR